MIRRQTLDAPRVAKYANLVVIENPRPNEEAQSLRSVQRKHAATARHHIESEMGVLPIFKLTAAHIERFAVDLAKLDIGVANHELATWIAHRGAAIAAA